MNTIEQFMALPLDVRNAFHNVASKSTEFHNGFEWFAAEIPANIADNVDAVKTVLDGGVAVVTRVVGDRGVAGGGYTETETIVFPDRDFSRHVSGHNGGEYTPDNVTLESASVNRSRGSDNMTADEIDTAQTALETDASLLADADMIIPAGETVMGSSTIGGVADIPVDMTNTVIHSGPGAEMVAAETGTSVLGEIGETVLDGLLPATVGVAMAKHVADQFDDDIDKIGFGSMAAGGTVALCMTPIGQFGLACYAGWNIAKLAKRGVRWVADNA